MRKKILALILIIIMATTVLSGCTLITKNNFRDGARVVAEVNFGGLTETVTKTELVEYFYNNGGTYIQYYGMTVEEVLDLFKESLANSKLSILKSRIAIAEKLNVPATTPISEMLNKAELAKAINDTNDIFQTSFDELYEEVKTEYELLEEDDDEEEEEEEEKDTHTHDSLLTPRTKKTVEEEKWDPYEVIEVLPKTFFDALEIKDVYGREAKKRLEKNLAESRRDYNYYLNLQYNSLIVTKYRREIIEETQTVTEEEIMARYKEILNANIKTYNNDESKYSTAINSGAGTNVLHTAKDYGYVQQILIKFNDAQTAAITSYSTNFSNNKDAIELFTRNMVKKLNINVSNADYDAEADCIGFVKDSEGNATDVKYDAATLDAHPIDHNCSDAACPLYPFSRLSVTYGEILAELGAELAECGDDIQKRLAVFDKWIYLINDDTGIFNNAAGYMITPEGQESSYVSSFTELGRILVKKGVGSYNVTAEDIADNIEKNNIIIDEATGLTYCVSNYGIHIMIVNNIACSGDSNIITRDDGQFELSLDYVVDNANGKTLRDSIRETILTEKKSDTYTYSNLNFLLGNKESIKYKDKLYNSILKEINKAING